MKFLLLLWIITADGLTDPLPLARFETLADCEAAVDTVKASGPDIIFIANCREEGFE